MQFRQFVENAEGFIKNIIESWPDTSPMLVYADWLEEQGDNTSQIYRDSATGKKSFIVDETGQLSTNNNIYTDVTSCSFEELVHLLHDAGVYKSYAYNAKTPNVTFQKSGVFKIDGRLREDLPEKMRKNPAVVNRWNERPHGAHLTMIYKIFYLNQELPEQLMHILTKLIWKS